ncbi:hypothetical protein KXD24_002037 [Staphylococcus pseudintermedius]|nr:hypothetical protein [Staphylococcus pseudintermedius]
MKKRIEIFYLENDKNLGNPKGSSRPRFSGGGHTYMPAPYVKHKKFVAEQLPDLMIDKPIRLTVLISEIRTFKKWDSVARTVLIIEELNNDEQDV